MTLTEEEKQRAIFNIVAEAKMYSFVDMTKKTVPPDQVRQFCEGMLKRALEAKGVPEYKKPHCFGNLTRNCIGDCGFYKGCLEKSAGAMRE